MHVQDALQYWVEKKLLTKKKADELQASLPQTEPHQQRLRAIEIFSAVGAILVGLGIILFVGSHWSEITPVFRVALLLTAMLGTGGIGYWLGYEKQTYPKIGVALLFVNILAYGAAIFLVAQIYHLPLTFWWGMLLWYLGTALFAYILRSTMHVWLSVPLLIVFIGWLLTDHLAAGEFDFLFNERTLFLGLFAPLGVGLVSKSLLHQRSAVLRFAAPTLFHWGLFLVLLLVVISTADKTFFFHIFRFPTDIVSLGVLIVSAILFVSALLWGGFQTKEGRGGLIALALYLGFLFLLGLAPGWLGININSTNYYAWQYVDQSTALTWLYVLHVILALVFQLTVVWYGTLLRQATVINLTLFGIAVTIIIQYFSWAFELLPRSFAFIVGGLIILGLGAVLERQRRKLLISIEPTA